MLLFDDDVICTSEPPRAAPTKISKNKSMFKIEWNLTTRDHRAKSLISDQSQLDVRNVYDNW